MVAASHEGTLKFKFELLKMKWNLKFSFSVVLARVQGLKSHAWLAATALAVQIQNISTITKRSIG